MSGPTPVATLTGIEHAVVSCIDGCRSRDVELREHDHGIEVGVDGHVLDANDSTVGDVEAAIGPYCPAAVSVTIYRMSQFRDE